MSSSSSSDILNHGGGEIQNKQGIGLLTLEDLTARHVNLNTNVSKFEALLVTAQVASVKHEEQERKRLKKSFTNPLISSRESGFSELVNGFYDSSLRIKAEGQEKKKGDVILANQETRIGSSKAKNTKEKKPSSYRYITVPDKQPHLPQEFEEKIAQMKGTDTKFVIQKAMTPTDVDDAQSRLTISKEQIKRKKLCILTEEEERIIKGGEGVKIRIIEPKLKVVDGVLKQWKNGKRKQYAFTTVWNDIRSRNGIVACDVIQVWSFRVKEILHFAFVKADNQSSSS